MSSARATLSPVPARKAVAREDEREAVQESGIVETSIKASSVIKQFETRKISKIKPDGEVFVEGESGWVMAVFQLGAMRVSYHTIACLAVIPQQAWCPGNTRTSSRPDLPGPSGPLPTGPPAAQPCAPQKWFSWGYINTLGD